MNAGYFATIPFHYDRIITIIVCILSKILRGIVPWKGRLPLFAEKPSTGSIATRNQVRAIGHASWRWSRELKCCLL